MHVTSVSHPLIHITRMVWSGNVIFLINTYVTLHYHLNSTMDILFVTFVFVNVVT